MRHIGAEVDVDWNGVDVYFFGDEQEGQPGFRREVWDEFMDEVRASKRERKTLLVQMGDSNDWLRPTMRAHLDQAMSRDMSAKDMLDNAIMLKLEQTLKRYEPLKGMLIGIHDGHHLHEFRSGATTTMVLAQYLGGENLGWEATTRLVMKLNGKPGSKQRPGRKNDGAHSVVFTFVSTHGNANGKATTSVARSMETSLANFVCDLKVMGHACRSASWTPHEYNVVRRSGPPGVTRVVPRHLLVGGFSDAYTNGWISVPANTWGNTSVKAGRIPATSYPERSNMTPQPLSWGLLRLRFKRSKALALDRGLNPGIVMLDAEAVLRGPGVDQDGNWKI